MDLSCLSRQWWLIVTQYYSRYPEIARLSSLSAATVVNQWKSIFARHGMPNEVISDNGPQFAGADRVIRISKIRRGIQVQTHHFEPEISPKQRHGRSSRKGYMKKTGDPYETLLSYRSTPLKNGYNPAELLMGRRLRTTLPVAEEMLLPKKVDHEAVKKVEKVLKQRQKQQYDRHYGIRPLSDLDEGQDVWVIDVQRRGCVKGPASTLRSYLMAAESGDLRRNRSHLIPLSHSSRDDQLAETTDLEGAQMHERICTCENMSHMHTRNGLCITPKTFPESETSKGGEM
ncbi:uncharacterized protein K02A2.6-like [Ornithodoros turicata]|uniref:uncharacterized protein K02A2.6-like n=1 Tax=Ornithodoros turicata TaxID=34597 RepID=UPI00313985A9